MEEVSLEPHNHPRAARVPVNPKQSETDTSKSGKDAVFLDGNHSVEKVRQLRHEMGFFDHRYFFCPPESLWPELDKLDSENEVFIDMPNLPPTELTKIHELASQRRWHLTVTARAVPSDLGEAEIINL